MQTNTTYPTAAGVDPQELDRHIAEMYRDVANEAVRDLHFPTGRPLAEALGYPAKLLDRLPAQAVNSFAGVGYHLGLARLLQGERVLDLGSGSGMDVFAAATQVTPGGSVTGVDITPAQLAKSERLRGDEHVRFRRARIEELPFSDGWFDAVISNGVVNLSADKRCVFAEAARVLRPGGRLALADIVTERPIAARTACQADLWAACIAGPARPISTWRTSRPPDSSRRCSRTTRATASRANGRSARATSTALTACRCSRSSQYLHPPTPLRGGGLQRPRASLSSRASLPTLTTRSRSPSSTHVRRSLDSSPRAVRRGCR